MYTVLKNTQIVIALLKEYGIKHVVISPGTRNGPFVKSVEDDPDFICYSVPRSLQWGLPDSSIRLL